MIYQRLKDLREDENLKQKDVAEIINTTANYYGDYEKGKRDIPTSRMIQLAKYYKVSMDYITGLTNDKGGMHKNNKEEAELLKLYNSLDEKRKGKAELYIEQLLKQQNKEVKEIENNISINQQNNGTATININNK